jgi:hypothetical protein
MVMEKLENEKQKMVLLEKTGDPFFVIKK